MCETDKDCYCAVKLSSDDTGNFTVSFNAYDMWRKMTEDEKELVFRDVAYWDVIQDALKYELSSGVTGPSFNSPCFKLRNLIATDEGFVGDVVAATVAQLLNEIARLEQDKRQAEQAYWQLYQRVSQELEGRIQSPSEVVDERAEGRYDFPSVYSHDIKEDVLNWFYDLIAEEFDGLSTDETETA